MQTSQATGLLIALACMQVFSAAAPAAQRNRIVGPIDNRNRVALRGHVHPQAVAENDQGRADPSQTLPYMTVVLKQSAAQQADLEQLLAQQQDPSSPNYHRWLSPEEYADRFGVSQGDLDQIVAWLQQQHFTVKAVARGRNWVAFSGSAGDVKAAFGTEIHRYRAEGRMHFANATEPTIPAALDQVVTGIRGLNDFRLRPAVRFSKPMALNSVQPNYNSTKSSNHYLAPDDVSTIYNIQPLYNAGIDGTAQSVVVVGQTKVNLSDIQGFRSYFNLPANDPKLLLVPNATDPGVSQDDLAEANLDIEWSGAVARNASIIYVYSDDVITSLQYAIDQNLAPVLSMSYGLCEALSPSSEARLEQMWARQANSQGMTWLAASGDSGAADCVGSSTRTGYGLQVDLPASVPEVTGIGGTTFNEGGGTYWDTTNSANHASALSYIPETAWNDSASDGSPSSTGGGASGNFSKPTWQVGLGVPNDGLRDVPDVSLSGSASHDGYLIYLNGALSIVGGTSVGAPSFAGMMALLNQYLVSKGVQASAGLGNINPVLYTLAQTTPNAFHDITTGDNIVNPCPSRARTCTPTPLGFSAGTGYDQVTGLGSVDAFNLVTSWNSGGRSTARSTPAVVLTPNAPSITSAGSTILTATVKSSNGGTPSGTVTFLMGTTVLGTAPLTGAGDTGTATVTVTGTQLAVGTVTITAQYSGDNSYNGATASTSITVTVSPGGPPSISRLANGASFQQSYAPGMVLTVFGAQFAPAAASAASVPLPGQLSGVSATINGVTAPLYYVSPGQLNIQIPYATAVNANALLTVSTNGQNTSASFRIAAAAPGIFTNAAGAPVPSTSATRGQVATLYITGEGLVSPAIATGSAPASGTPIANLPKPQQAVSVTVGGVGALVQFAGIPAGLVGVSQINYQIPSGVALGPQAVVVTVGGVSSQAATLTVTP